MGQHFGATPFLIAGPCVVESDALNLRIGEALAELGTKLGVHVIYKASYDKANRSRLKGARGRHERSRPPHQNATGPRRRAGRRPTRERASGGLATVRKAPSHPRRRAGPRACPSPSAAHSSAAAIWSSQPLALLHVDRAPG